MGLLHILSDLTCALCLTGLRLSIAIGACATLNMEAAMPNLNEMLDSKYLKSGDFPEPMIGTIQDFQKVNMAREGQEAQYRWTVKFREWPKAMVCNKTNLKRMAKMFDSENTDNWIGKKVVIFYDENVEMAGETVGGLRVRAPQSKQQKRPLQDPREDQGIDSIDDDIPF